MRRKYGTLDETDFDFCKSGQNEKDVKGSVRRKINALPAIMDMFNVGTSVEEDFTKNRIRCSLAAANISATLGFIVAGKAIDKGLLDEEFFEDTDNRQELIRKVSCYKYSMGLSKFQALAKEAKATYKVDKLVLVNCDLFEKYLETFREY